ncbi:MAG: cyclase family protein [Candidatus Velthaea sp.]
MSAARRWTHRPPGSNWGDFGPDDQVGRLHLLTPERVRAAAAEIVAGRTFALSLPLDYPGGSVLAPHRFPPKLHPTERAGQAYFNFDFSHEGAGFTDVGCDDAVTLCTQYSTQWDSLVHIGQAFDADGDGQAEFVYYNGYRAGRDILPPSQRGAQPMPLGIENMAATGVQGRGVMVDLAHHFGRERRVVGYDDLMHVMHVDNVRVESGDFLCLHTGLARVLLEMQREPDDSVKALCPALDGSDERLQRWITDSGIVAIVADNYAVEHLPARGNAESRPALPLHAHCIFKLGMHLGELWYLSELNDWLRENNRNRFFLTAPPLRLPGAVGSPLTPVATV